MSLEPGNMGGVWRAHQRAKSAPANPYVRTRELASQIKNNFGIELRVSKCVLTSKFSSLEIEELVKGEWGSADALNEVISQFESGLKSFENKFSKVMGELGYKATNMGLILDVPRSKDAVAWQSSFLYACIKKFAAEAKDLGLVTTYGRRDLSDPEINIPSIMTGEKAEKAFRTLLIVLNGSIDETMQFGGPVPIDSLPKAVSKTVKLSADLFTLVLRRVLCAPYEVARPPRRRA